MNTTKIPATIEQNGRLFPAHNGKALSWVISATHEDRVEGFPRLRSVIRAMRELRPEQLAQERRELIKDSFGQLFGHNAKELLKVIESEVQS